MRRCFLLFIHLIFLGTICFSQSNNDSITINDYAFKRFNYKGQNLTMSEVMWVMEDNSSAFQEMSFAKFDRDMSNSMVFTGLGFIAFPIIMTILDKEPNWNFAAVGIPLMIFSFPFNSSSERHYMNAVRIYNRDLKKIDKINGNTALVFGLNRFGIGITLKF